MSNVKALEGQWYSDRSTHDIFCVIAVDESDGSIGVRDGYGDIDEFDLDEWSSMDLELCAAPDERAMWWDDRDSEDTEVDSGARRPSAAAPDMERQPPQLSASHHIKSSGTT